MKKSNSSNSSSISKQSQNIKLSNQKTKASFLRKLKTEDFALRKKLMNQNCFGKLRVLIKECQQHIYILLEDPQSSKLAKGIQIILLLSILLSCISIIVDSIYESSNGSYDSVSSSIELYLFVFFGVEYLLRLFSTSAFDKSLLQFIVSPMNLIDFVSILPFLLSSILTEDSFSQLRVLRLIRFIRIFRLFKLSRFLKEISMLAETVRNSLKDMLMLIVMLFLMVIFFSTIIYYLEYNEDENDQVENRINSIPEAIWWCIVTMTTVGYGDLIPHTIEGKFIACITALLGTTTISLPVAIMGINFYRTLKENEETEEIDRLKQKYQITNEAVTNDQLNLRELQFMKNRLEQLYENNEKVLDYLVQSQQLFDELTANLMSLYKALSEEIDLHLEYRMRRLKMKQRIMKIEKNIEQKKSIEINQLIHSYRENKRKMALSPMMDESRIESLNSVHSRLQSLGNMKRSRASQLKHLKSSSLFKSSKEINYDVNSELKSENFQIHEIHLPDPMEDTPLGDQQIRKSELEVSIRNDSEEHSQYSRNQENCDIQNKITSLKQQKFNQTFLP
ncbi:unnamed protein product [Paramecium sonneborni]|uniref:Ion transport domain-containing protein n=2 Tax=Paramecium sonneborni TaxID=65129 RepID=A0A8S1R3D8_9CILI|nr:unnamed protein product [Paramecium sonneborni]